MIYRPHPDLPKWFQDLPQRKYRQDQIDAWVAGESPRLPRATFPQEYLTEDLLRRFSAFFDDKCVYCECQIKRPSDTKVSYFRPWENAFQTEGENTASYHYRWLGWEWSNLYLACPDCEGSLSFRIFLVVANSRQYWPKRAGYAEKAHWEHGVGAVDT